MFTAKHNAIFMKKGKIYIYGAIGDGAVSAEYISERITWLQDQGVQSFIVYINSSGGSYFDGLAIYDLLKPLNPEVRISGVAASAAALIAMAGESISISENAYMLVHNVSTYPQCGSHTEADFQKGADELKTIGKTMKSIFVQRTGRSTDEVEKLLDQDTWLNPGDALSWRFVDKIVSPETINREVKNFVLNQIPVENNRHAHNNPKPKETLMDLQTLIALLGMAEDSTEEQVTAELKALMEPAPDGEQTPQQENEDEPKIESRLQAIEAAQADQVNQAKQAVIDAMVDQAINERRILPADRDTYVSAAQNDFDATQKRLKAISVDTVAQKPVKPGSEKAADQNTLNTATDYFKSHGRTLNPNS